MSHPTNQQRAMWAAAAVRAHVREGGGDDDDSETHISDLLCNLAHLADGHGLDPVRLIRRALYHHAAELGDACEMAAEDNSKYQGSPHWRLFGPAQRLRGTLVPGGWADVEAYDEADREEDRKMRAASIALQRAPENDPATD